MTAFADPAVRFGLGFEAVMPEAIADETVAAPQPVAGSPVEGSADAPAETPSETPQVVSLDAFRRRPPAKK
jgi:hypothetical protein